MVTMQSPTPFPISSRVKPTLHVLRPSHFAAIALIGAQAFLTPVAQGQTGGTDFVRCLDRLQAQAPSKGVSSATFESLRPQMVWDETVLPLLDKQPEFSTPIWDYLAALVDDERVRDGKAAMQQNQNALDRIASRYAIDPYMVAAVWGVESNFGRIMGGRHLLSSLASLSCAGRRQNFFQGELLATVKIVQQGHIQPEKLVGSWAGAFGQTQFMPSTFLSTAVDLDGDGRRDVVDNAGDALASTANFLKKAGWISGQPWGFEVRIPPGFDARQAGRVRKQALSHWQALGIRRVDGRALTHPDAATEAAFTPQQEVALLLPAGSDGPAFLVGRNFDAIYAYNAAESYALAIALLRDQLAGVNKGLVAQWPTDDPGLSRAERRELQGLLLLKGYDIGQADGMIGDKTRRALVQVQQQLGLKADGRAGRKTLLALQKSKP